MQVKTHIDGDKVDFRVTVLAGFGGGHFDDLAWTALDNDVTAANQVGSGSALDGMEGMCVLLTSF